VVNNPIRYKDPTGHMCSDPEDPTPTCEGRGRPIGAVYDNPIVSGYINIITIPEPLDDGLIPDSLPRRTYPELIPICYYDPTLYAAYLTATPTGPLPTLQTILLQGPTSTPTYPPTPTLDPGWLATSVADFMPGVPPNLFESNPGLKVVGGSDTVDKGLTLYEFLALTRQNTPPISTWNNYQKVYTGVNIFLIIVTILPFIIP
jgi:hypothetical protein